MALQLKLDSLDSVDEAFKALYKKEGEKFVLDVEGVEDVTGLKNTIKAVKAERDQAAKAARELKIAQEEAEQLRLKESGDFKTLAEQSAAKELETSKELKKLRSELSEKAKAEMAGTVIAGITKGVDVTRANLMRDQALKYIQTDEAGNTIIAGPDGINDAGKLSEHLKGEFPFLAGASPAGGGGGHGGVKTGVSESLLKLSPIERINAARAMEQ